MDTDPWAVVKFLSVCTVVVILAACWFGARDRDDEDY